MEALSAGSIECMKLLLDRGAKVNQQDKVSVLIRDGRGGGGAGVHVCKEKSKLQMLHLYAPLTD